MINPKLVGRISDKARHMGDWEKSPDRDEMARYHFVDVDDRDRKSHLLIIIQPLLQWGNLIKIRSVEGKVEGTKFRYLFESYDVNQKPELLDFARLGKKIKRDKKLVERIKPGYSVEQYVEKIYRDRF